MTDGLEDRMVVWKFTLPPIQDVTLEMPRQAKILRVEFQEHDLQLWAMVDPEMPRVTRKFAIRGTGQDASGLWWETFIGTAIHPSASLVVHIWELTNG